MLTGHQLRRLHPIGHLLEITATILQESIVARRSDHLRLRNLLVQLFRVSLTGLLEVVLKLVEPREKDLIKFMLVSCLIVFREVLLVGARVMVVILT